MTDDTIHTCSYYCERPGCIRAQRDELRDRMESVLAKQPPVEGEEIMVNAGHDVFILPLQPSGLSSGPRFVVHVPVSEAPPAGCHCGTCTCNPNMTPAVRFDLSPAQMEGAIRDHLIALGWTPPGAQQPAAVDGLAARLVDELDGLVGESYGVSGLHLNGDAAPWDELLPGGRFERLSSLDDLRAALAAKQQGGAA